ncbi:MAG: hypothetical protein Phog2KO_44270 [Phototrophicaceae bacterium]
MKILGKNKENGQSLIEMALTLPLLLLLLSGLLDLGRAYYTYIALEEAAAEAAIYLAISPDCPAEVAGLTKCEDPNNALYRAETSGNGEFDASLVEWNIPFTPQKQSLGWRSPFAQDDSGTTASDCSALGCTVVVQLRYPFEFLTPGMQAFLDNTNNIIFLNVQASQIIVYDQR